jgi:hypothetical protein
VRTRTRAVGFCIAEIALHLPTLLTNEASTTIHFVPVNKSCTHFNALCLGRLFKRLRGVDSSGRPGHRTVSQLKQSAARSRPPISPSPASSISQSPGIPRNVARSDPSLRQSPVPHTYGTTARTPSSSSLVAHTSDAPWGTPPRPPAVAVPLQPHQASLTPSRLTPSGTCHSHPHAPAPPAASASPAPPPRRHPSPAPAPFHQSPLHLQASPAPPSRSSAPPSRAYAPASPVVIAPPSAATAPSTSGVGSVSMEEDKAWAALASMIKDDPDTLLKAHMQELSQAAPPRPHLPPCPRTRGACAGSPRGA